jgi:hypothetical protein
MRARTVILALGYIIFLGTAVWVTTLPAQLSI